jgi:DNA-binding NtrC family response regulator
MLEILLVDDEPSVRLPIGGALRAQGHHVTLAADGAEAMARLDSTVFDVVVSDVRLPKVDGFTILRRLRDESPGTDVLLITAYGTIDDAIVAMKEHAVDYVTKPFDVEELVLTVERIGERRRLKEELSEARAQLQAMGSRHSLVGRCPSMRRLQDQIDAIAHSDAAVLLSGESGTGKELVAHQIHDRSPRHGKAFVTVNCAAIPPALLEAELFGHERGAFTGAVRRRDGRFKAADGGTLFLDEIGELPLEAQAKVLRVLQGDSFEPIGSNRGIKVDVRIISATHRDLRSFCASGRFREDLYYRVRVFELALPPLRERSSDLPLLVEHFLSQHAPAGQAPQPLSPAAWAALRQYGFPGNVRELEHMMEHAVVLSRGLEIELCHFPQEIRGDHANPAKPTLGLRPLSLAVEDFEREYLVSALRLAGGEKRRAAAMLGISRKCLWQKLRQYGVTPLYNGEATANDHGPTDE